PGIFKSGDRPVPHRKYWHRRSPATGSAAARFAPALPVIAARRTATPAPAGGRRNPFCGSDFPGATKRCSNARLVICDLSLVCYYGRSPTATAQAFKIMTQDERLIPARPGADFETRLSELSQSRAYGKYGRYGVANETNLREYLHIILKRKWIILSLILIITSLVTIQAYRQPSIYEGATIIQIQPRQQSVLQTGQISIAAPTDPKFWETQLRLLQ